MAAEDAHKIAIITPVGLYEYKMMPFGLRNSGNTYQRYIDQVTRGLPFCFAYVDDVLVASHSFEEHEHHLRLLLDRFKQNGVTLNKEKCEIAVTNLTFLGHHISTKGFESIEQKVQTITKFPKPQSMKQLRRFLGMINFYRRFIPGCAETFRYFIEGRTFTVFTDHAPLCKAIFSRSQNSSPRQQRHLDFIAQFTSDLRYVKGEKNVVADCLSRITASVFEKHEAINFLEMAAAQQHDPIIDHIQTSKNSLKLEYKPLPNQGESILGDMSTGKFRPLVPEAFRRKVFDSFHSLSHPGIKGTQKLISRRYIWPGIKR